MKTKLEIIEETAEYYSQNPRGISDEGDCLYLSGEGRMCAVGRCLEGVLGIEGYKGNIRELEDDWGALEDLLKPEYRGHPLDFWEDLQCLHDSEDYWSDDGLSEKGKSRLKNMKINCADD